MMILKKTKNIYILSIFLKNKNKNKKRTIISKKKYIYIYIEIKKKIFFYTLFLNNEFI